MSFITTLFSLVLHMDKHIAWVVERFGNWSYLIIFFVIFLETGMVFTPFLPGDSLLFAAGALAALGTFHVITLFILLSIAAVLGDSVNYAIGHFLGEKILKLNTPLLKKHHLDRAHRFYEKHGAETIIIARFIPIVRTFAPFIAGAGTMRYWKFISYNIIGGIAWVAVFLFGGYFFGNIPFVRDNFALVILAIIIVSLTPVAIEVILHYKNKKNDKKLKSKS